MNDTIGVSSSNDLISKQVPVSAIGTGDEVQTKQIKENLQKYEQLFGADEDAFEQPTTTKKELWSYYLYYNVSLILEVTLKSAVYSHNPGRQRCWSRIILSSSLSICIDR